MFAPIHDFFRAIHHARKATRRGDPVAASRWLNIAERHLAVSDRLIHLSTTAPEAEAEAPPRRVPEMLDPKGVSPGGTPNWVLNLRRLERAGLRPGEPGVPWPAGTPPGQSSGRSSG